jgi:hypothetical protein
MAVVLRVGQARKRAGMKEGSRQCRRWAPLCDEPLEEARNSVHAVGRAAEPHGGIGTADAALELRASVRQTRPIEIGPGATGAGARDPGGPDGTGEEPQPAAFASAAACSPRSRASGLAPIDWHHTSIPRIRAASFGQRSA